MRDVRGAPVIAVLSQGLEMQRLTPENHSRFSWSGWKNLLLPQLNRRSLYVYGSEVAVEKECVRQKEGDVLVIHPFSCLRYCNLSWCFYLVEFLKKIHFTLFYTF